MPMLDKSIRRRKGSTMGDLRYGAPGGGRTSAPFICSYALANSLASAASLDRVQAHRIVMAMGRVMQKLLLAGEPVGLPHVGTLHMVERRIRVRPASIVKHNLAATGVLSGPVKQYKLRVRSVKLSQPKPLRRVYSDNAVYTGGLQVLMRRAAAKNRKQLSIRYDKSIEHTRG